MGIPGAGVVCGGPGCYLARLRNERAGIRGPGSGDHVNAVPTYGLTAGAGRDGSGPGYGTSTSRIGSPVFSSSRFTALATSASGT
jgi:hypothetical protein